MGLKSYYRTGLGICRIRMVLGNCGWAEARGRDRTLELWGRDLESYRVPDWEDVLDVGWSCGMWLGSHEMGSWNCMVGMKSR